MAPATAAPLSSVITGGDGSTEIFTNISVYQELVFAHVT
jgi:hypothetical protein